MFELLNLVFQSNLSYIFFIVIFSSIICSILGVFIVFKRLIYLADSIGHVSIGAVGIVLFFGLHIFWGTIFITLFMTFILSVILSREKVSSDSIIGMFWVFGMSIGIIAIDKSVNTTFNLNSYLFGNLILASQYDIYFLLFLSILILIIYLLLDKSFIYAFIVDKTILQLKGYNIFNINLCLYILISLIIISLNKVFGVLLLTALLTIPPNISICFVDYSINTTILISFVVNLFSITLGMLLSFYFDCPISPLIVVIEVIILIISKLFKYIFTR